MIIILKDYNNVITLKGNSSLVTCLVFLPVSGYLVTGNETGKILLWNIFNGTLINMFNYPPKIR
jgi:WD40 repeat protein